MPLIMFSLLQMLQQHSAFTQRFGPGAELAGAQGPSVWKDVAAEAAEVAPNKQIHMTSINFPFQLFFLTSQNGRGGHEEYMLLWQCGCHI